MAKRTFILRLSIFAVLLVAVCAATSYVTVSLSKGGKNWTRHDEMDGHLWLHEQLGLSPEEAAAIDTFEAPYRERRARLQVEFDARIANLAEMIRANDSLEPQVTAAIHEIHIAHGQLQQLAIEHYYKMLNALPPDKQDRLKAMAIQALSTPE